MSLVCRMIRSGRGFNWSSSSASFYNLKVSFTGIKKKTHLATITLNRNYCTEYNVNNTRNASDKVKIHMENKNDEMEIIYTGQQNRNIRNIKMISLSTSMLTLSSQPLVYHKAVEAGQITTLTIPIFALLALFAVATPILLNLVTKRYILNIEYFHKDDKYVATVYSLLARKKRIEFTPDDVTIPTVGGMFTNCAIKRNPMFLDSQSFSNENQKHYVRIMGYDKPIDLKEGIHFEEDLQSKKEDKDKT